MNFGLLLTKTYSEYFGSGHYYEFGAQKRLDAATSGSYEIVLMIASFFIVGSLIVAAIKLALGNGKVKSEAKQKIPIVIGAGCAVFALVGFAVAVVNLASNFKF